MYFVGRTLSMLLIYAKGKPLRSYDQQFNPPYLVPTTLSNFKQDGKIDNVPLYDVGLLSNLLK